MARKCSHLQEHQTKFRYQCTFKKGDQETFSFCVNDISAKEEALFDICGLRQISEK